jgi:colanic acid/amylovoran biosynthesis glycosyltransferase
VKTGENGWLIPAGSGEALTDALVEVMSAPVSLLESMGARGREAVRRLHSARKEASKLASFLLRSNGRSATAPTPQLAVGNNFLPPFNAVPESSPS